jgi:hypothetical protein
MVLHRLQGNGVQRMPPLGTSERDLVAEQLLTDWINQSLPARRSFSQWQTERFGSTTAPAAQLAADPDSDGRRNDFEYLAGTDPLVPDGQNAWPGFTQGIAQIDFTQPANRSALIEVSTNLVDWFHWNVAGNSPSFPATAQPRSFTVPIGADPQFFRLRLSEP